MGRRNWVIVAIGTALLAVAIVWFTVSVTGEGDGPDDWRGLTMAVMAIVGISVVYRGMMGRKR